MSTNLDDSILKENKSESDAYKSIQNRIPSCLSKFGKGMNIFDHVSYICLPLHRGVHWKLCVINVGSATGGSIDVVDSLGGKRSRRSPDYYFPLSNMENQNPVVILSGEAETISNFEGCKRTADQLFNPKEWTARDFGPPIQGDMTSCGPLTILNLVRKICGYPIDGDAYDTYHEESELRMALMGFILSASDVIKVALEVNEIEGNKYIFSTC